LGPAEIARFHVRSLQIASIGFGIAPYRTRVIWLVLLQSGTGAPDPPVKEIELEPPGDRSISFLGPHKPLFAQ